MPETYLRDMLAEGLLEYADRMPEAHEIFEALGGPKHLYLCPGVGHASCLSSDSQRWTTLVSAFVAKPVADGGPSALQ